MVVMNKELAAESYASDIISKCSLHTYAKTFLLVWLQPHPQTVLAIAESTQKIRV